MLKEGGYYSHGTGNHFPMTSQEHHAARSLDCDVIIIGGGPAGTTAATELVRRGHKVQLFEKSRHPRFHIGESLLPMNIPILERLGVLEEVDRIGVRKPAADFPADNERGFNVFDFSKSLERLPGYAPDLNPVECLWGYLKYGRLANFVPRHVRHLDGVVVGELEAIRGRPELLKSLWRGSDLPFPELALLS